MANKRQKRQCKKKIAYDTIKEARQALAHYDPNHDRVDPPTNFYRCPACDKFHLTGAITFKRRKTKGGFTGHTNNRT